MLVRSLFWVKLFPVVGGFAGGCAWHPACDVFLHSMNHTRPSRSNRRRPATPAAAPPQRNGRPETAPRTRVLVVDDHADTRDLLVTVLKTEGYDVVLAEDGDVAMRRYRERPADIVLMDLYMPRQDGVTTIRELYAEFPGVVVVAMSGDAGTPLA
jgi:PleD family two-component response regulator